MVDKFISADKLLLKWAAQLKWIYSTNGSPFMPVIWHFYTNCVLNFFRGNKNIFEILEFLFKIHSLHVYRPMIFFLWCPENCGLCWFHAKPSPIFELFLAKKGGGLNWNYFQFWLKKKGGGGLGGGELAWFNRIDYFLRWNHCIFTLYRFFLWFKRPSTKKLYQKNYQHMKQHFFSFLVVLA